MLLSRNDILQRMEEGTIIIDPFDERNLGNSSYDVTLGSYYYREVQPDYVMHRSNNPIYNMYDKKDVDRVWGGEHFKAKSLDSYNMQLENIKSDDKVIWLDPGESVLGHTQEFIGGLVNVNTEMKARSSMGRNFMTVCRCAGWGDVGYINRWTMEITNNSRFHRIPLVVGRRVAQITFSEVTEVTNDHSYEKKAGSKYQTETSLDELKKKWTPKQMIPRMWLDREVGES